MATLPLKIEHRIGVQAPAEAVWPMIVDLAGWGGWNPLYPKAEGAIGFGAMLTLELTLPGEPPRTIRPTVRDWTPNEQIIWTLSMFGGLLRSTRYIEIETLTETGCIFSNGEIFEGPLMQLIPKRLRRAIKAGFTAFGEAVRDRAEQAWRSEDQAATYRTA
jgi:hypothetical protein